MPRYTYVALDSRGQESTGLVEANSKEVKAVKQKAKAIRATAPAKEKKGIVLFERKTVKTKILMIFTRQLATLIDSGLPLPRALTVLAKQERDKVLKKTIGNLSDAVQGGSTFSEGLAQHPKIFN